MDLESSEGWIEWFLNTKGNEYFCEVDTDFILDRFNLTGLNTEVPNIQGAIEMITRPIEHIPDDEETKVLESSARHLYGLIHARYILTTRGIQKMMEKYTQCDFGRCPRALCRSQPLLPIGLSDRPRETRAKLYCPKCEDVYNPRSNRHINIDGAYFGTSFPGMFFQAYPKLLPKRSSEQFILKVFGFKIHENAELSRWQQKQREQLERRVDAYGIR